MPLFLMMTNSPQQRANWEPTSESPVVSQGNTVKDQWWWATRTREELDAVTKELRNKNPNPVPPIQLSIQEVDEIPPGYR